MAKCTFEREVKGGRGTRQLKTKSSKTRWVGGAWDVGKGMRKMKGKEKKGK